jgi:predicted small secreted protein
MKKKQTALIVLLFCCTNFIRCGTLGGVGDDICFPTSMAKLKIAIDSLHNIYPEYKIPKKWEGLNNWSRKGYYDFLVGRIFYFKSSPEEMYYVTFIGDSFEDTTKICIGIRSVFRESTYKWANDDSLVDKEKERIVKRFDNEIVSKLEKITKTKARKE